MGALGIMGETTSLRFCFCSRTENGQVMLRGNKGRLCVDENPNRVLTLNEQEWQKLEQATVLRNVALAFDTNKLSDVESDAGSEVSEDSAHRGVAGDANTLASLLQQQIDAINKELK